MDGLSAFTTVVATLETAWKVIQYVQAVRDAGQERQKLLLELIRARGLLATLKDLVQDAGDEEWSRALQSLDGREGPLNHFRSLLEEMMDEGGIAGTVATFQLQHRDPNQCAWITLKAKLRRYLGRGPSPQQSFTPSRKQQGIAPPTKIVHNKTTTIMTKAGQDLKWPFTQERVQQLLETLERIKTHFLVALSSDNIRLSKLIQSELGMVNARVENIHNDTGAILEQVEGRKEWTDEQNLIFRSIATLDFSTNMMVEEMELVKRSSQWFLQQEDFRRWYGAGGSLLLTGGPGTGKTMIAKAVENYIRASDENDRDFVVALHFSFLNSPEIQSLQSVLAFIVQQMLEVRPRLQKYYNKLMLTGEGPLDANDSLRIIHRARQDYRKFFIIFDGLDECDGQLVHDLIQRLTNLRGRLRVFATSRATPTLQPNTFSFRVELAVPVDGQRLFIQQNLQTEKSLAWILDSDPAMLDQLTEIIMTKSHGILIYAKLIIQSLAAVATKEDLYEALQDIPPNLQSMYEQRLSAVMHQQHLDAKLAVRILQKLKTQPDLNEEEIVNMMGEEGEHQSGNSSARQDLMKRCVRCCQGFVEAHDGELYLIHISAREFLQASTIAMPD